MKLRAVFNKKFGQWRLCHDGLCKPGESSIVATITTTLDDNADERLAMEMAARWNAGEVKS